jgi:hypothetical protein
VTDNPSGEAFVWSGSELLLTHCRHGLDLRLNPRCYLCDPLAATPAPLDVTVAAKHAAAVLNSCGDIYFHPGCKEAGAALRAAIKEQER